MCEIRGQLQQLENPDPQVLIGELIGAAMPKAPLQWAEDNPDAPLGSFARRSLSELASHQTLLVYLTPAEAEEDPGVPTMGRAFRDHHDVLHDLGVLVIGVSTQPLAEQHEIASVELYPQTLLCDELLVLVRALGLPVTIDAAKVEYQPIVLIVADGRIVHVIYPIDSPRRSAEEALEWLTEDASSDRPRDGRHEPTEREQ